MIRWLLINPSNLELFLYLRSKAFLVSIIVGVCIFTKYIPDGKAEASQLTVWYPDVRYLSFINVDTLSPSILYIEIETLDSDGKEYETVKNGLNGLGYKLWMLGLFGSEIDSCV